MSPLEDGRGFRLECTARARAHWHAVASGGRWLVGLNSRSGHAVKLLKRDADVAIDGQRGVQDAADTALQFGKEGAGAPAKVYPINMGLVRVSMPTI